MTGRMIVVNACDLRIGDVFSTDGGVVTEIEELPPTHRTGRGPRIRVGIVCHGVYKEAMLTRYENCRLWQEGG